ncbi:hypothetical protein EV649_4605 [Kribbella sp. VKM Ac-2569]|uniref:HAD family hydrolase n=1 Tax=Kribbella sp. VKM Ac-2569 TaxID=2512220 RepID=UPI00102CA3B0|nr:HAD family hydrolase [Kribbella sp. VKM Ac-2569]RZT17068.1 hypothetical protein EV649_4605 [Kribbella sp. VKM Ac-2569]
MKVLLSDLFSTLVSGGDAERDVVNARMGAVLGVDAVAFQRAFDASSYERFIGAYGDLPSTLRVIAERCGGTPTDEQVQEATGLRRALAQRLLGRVPVATLETLAAFKAAGWRIGLVSNITAETQVQWSTSPLAQYFDATAFSAEVGAAAASLGMRTIRTLEHANSDPTWQGPTIKTFAELRAATGAEHL